MASAGINVKLCGLAGSGERGLKFGQDISGAVLRGVVAEDGTAHALPVRHAAQYAVVGHGRINHAQRCQLQREATAQAKANTAHAFAQRAQERGRHSHIGGGLLDV